MFSVEPTCLNTFFLLVTLEALESPESPFSEGNMFQTRFHGSHVAVMSTLALMELLPLTLAVGVLPQTWAGYIHHEAESVPIRGPDPLQRRCWRWVWGWPGWP